ncbi:hypothetical protein Bacsa_0665 [Phocaeicola salanitronis DSM 18170]|uniref:Uncharacterized protein n=1 Tax=Phocaeicola salanitronis (strain DSM 18170 / JCM 13657 / CCUG 60908 / BL78) TaxID=667015 RepID=F0R104_PHOSB|nr:hypothetical protein Bacsa_0665 [Phocaeicola salanitronis DSM 18170]
MREPLFLFAGNSASPCLCVLYSPFNVQKYKKCGNKSRSFYFFDYL